MVAADYPFLDLMWTMLIFFLWIAWFWVLIGIIADVFRRHDIGGWAKALWVLFICFLPLIGVLVYVGMNGKGMAQRNVRDVQAQEDYIRTVAGSGGAAAEIEKAKQLLDSGAIDAEEYAAIKRKAIAAGAA